MKHWINRNFRTLIISAFLIPIIIVAVVSISHVTLWYNISNPITWAIYLSIGIEIGALSSLAAISANMGRRVYFPFIIVTFIQFIGNIFFAYSYIDISSEYFKSWVELTSPILDIFGVSSLDLISHKRVLSFLGGGFLPIISLTFLGMLIKFTEDERIKDIDNEKKEALKNSNNEEIKGGEIDEQMNAQPVHISEDDLAKIENILKNKVPINVLKKEKEQPCRFVSPKLEQEFVTKEVEEEFVAPKPEEEFVTKEAEEEFVVPKPEEEFVTKEVEEEFATSELEDEFMQQEVEEEFVSPKLEDEFIPQEGEEFATPDIDMEFSDDEFIDETKNPISNDIEKKKT